jgi:hypothetical protein
MKFRGVMFLCAMFVSTPLMAASIHAEVGLTRATAGQYRSPGSAVAYDMFGYDDPGEYMSIVHEIWASGGDYTAFTVVASFAQGANSPYSGTVEMQDVAVPPSCYWAQIHAESNWAQDSASSPTECLSGPARPPIFHGSDGGTDWFDPLILDLNGDGIRTSGDGRPISFDLDADGAPELITWLEPDSEDAFLWTDLNQNNRVDDGAELFGIGTLLPDGRRASNGYEALAMYDTPARGGDGNGRIDVQDAIWSQLRLWRDDNHDRRCDGDERAPISRYGVISIGLTTVNLGFADESGTLHLLRGSYTLRNHGSVEEHAVEALGFRSLSN